VCVPHVGIPGAALDVVVDGSGEPIVFIQTALTADELRPLADAPALAGHRRIVYHRRGYGGSSPVDGPGSIRQDAADCRALLAALDLDRAHIVGLSYSAAVALQLAADAPAVAATLTLLEPPPVHTASAPEFRAANDRLMRSRRARGADEALEDFMSTLVGPGWRTIADAWLPGSVEQMRHDAATFIDTDLPALLAWRYGPDDARRVACPVLHIGGTDSGPWFAEVRRVILDWFPHADDVVIQGADHNLALTHTAAVADALLAFLRRHPRRIDRAV
jgi:pimeloyl-ACP methyl ester carboxylesterase